MGKKAALFEEAKRLFVQEGISQREIAKRLRVTAVTVHRWKTEGDWDTARARYLAGERHFIDMMHQIKRSLAEKVLDDLNNADAAANPQSIYALATMIRALKPYSALELKKMEEEESRKELTLEEREALIKNVIKDVYGIS